MNPFDELDDTLVLLPALPATHLDTLALAFDVSLNMVAGQPVTDLTAQVIVESSGQVYADGLVAGPILTTANVIQATVGNLVGGVHYLLEIGYRVDPDTVLSFGQPLATVF